MRLHLVGLPHTETTTGYSSCAFTANIIKFARMMHDRWELVIYSGEHNDAPCREHVPLVGPDEQLGWYGQREPHGFYGVDWDPAAAPWRTMNDRAIRAIRERADPDDLLLLIAGMAQQSIAAALGMPTVEWAVGYAGPFAEHRVYPSNAWRHYVHGWEHARGLAGDNGRATDAVIPHPVDPAELPVADGGDYLLYVGRLIRRKGIELAALTARRTGRRLVVAGQGGRQEGDTLVCSDVTVAAPGLEYLGDVGVEARAALMGGAYAVVMPTLYLEPFGLVAVEAMTCGTPVLTTDWGAFPETVADGVSGFRCKTIDDFVAGAERVGELDRARVADYARRFSLASIGPRYDDYLRPLAEAGMPGRA